MDRRACSQWPRLLAPAPGALPPASDLRTEGMATYYERVLHVALRSDQEKQPGLARALRGLGDYDMVDWCAVEREHGPQAIGAKLIQAARAFRPTIVFMQLQRGGVVTPELARALRLECSTNAVIVNWDGDLHHAPSAPQRDWFIALGRECDISLIATSEPSYLDHYDGMGVRHVGFLACGYDEQIYRPIEPMSGMTPIVLLAGNYPHIPGYDRRRELVNTLTARYGEKFAVYGNGWDGYPAGRPWVKQAEESLIYAGAVAAISMSLMNHLARCTSDRLFRALGSGTCVLTEQFPGMDGLGLRYGVNCFSWQTSEQLLDAIDVILSGAEVTHIRGAAAEMAKALHSWPARVRELLAMVYAVREDRRVR